MGRDSMLAALPPGQFRVFVRDAATTPSEPSAKRLALDDLVLEHHEALPVRTLRDGSGGTIAVVLGAAFDTGARDFVKENAFAEIAAASDPEVALEALYGRLFGSFALIVRLKGRYFFYLDACGTLSAVYSKERRIAGATAGAILSLPDYESLFRRELYKKLDVINEGWFPSGLTAHLTVSRLLANHRLDLCTMEQSRHWPPSAPQRAEDAAPLIDEIASATRANIEVILDKHRSALALTGGGDSRALLALSRRRRQEITAYTVAARTVDAEMDVALASRLAAVAEIKHAALAVPNVSDPTVRQWHYRCGHAVGGGNATAHAALQQLEGTQALLEGHAAETARGFFWKTTDNPATRIDETALCGRFGMPLTAETLSATEDWLQDAPSGDAQFLLDLAYLELRVSPWAFAQSYVDSPLRHFSPFASRAVLSRMFELPVEFKRSDSFARAVVSSEWPELLSIPFNRYGDYRDTIKFLRKATSLRLVRKKIRKLMAR